MNLKELREMRKMYSLTPDKPGNPAYELIHGFDNLLTIIDGFAEMIKDYEEAMTWCLVRLMQITPGDVDADESAKLTSKLNNVLKKWENQINEI